jgi:hypothetical protein
VEGLKEIYGMPQAGREFWKLVRSILLKLGFNQSEHVHSFFWKRTVTSFMVIMTYVDDLTFTTDSESMRAEVFAAINDQVTIEDLGVLNSFLDMDFKYHLEESCCHITEGTFTKKFCANMGFHPSISTACWRPEVKRQWTVESSTTKDDDDRHKVNAFNPH